MQSSAAGHAGLRFDPLLSGSLPEQTGIEDWAAWLHEKEDPATIERLRQHTRTGRPLGDETFIRRLERICGHVLRPKKAGRPRKVRRTRR